MEWYDKGRMNNQGGGSSSCKLYNCNAYCLKNSICIVRW